MPRDDVVVPLNRDGKHQPPSQPPTDSGRPVIVLEDGQIHESANQGEQALIDARANVYQRGGGLVAIADKGPDDHIQREPLAPRLVVVSPVHLRELLTRHAAWLRYDGRRQDYRAVDCPMSVAATISERGQWRFSELTGLIHAPTLREDGSLLFRPGYDSASGLYLILDGGTAIDKALRPAELTRERAAESAKLLMNAFASFPFVSPADHVAAAAAVMTGIVARSVSAVPMAVLTATTAGTGKSKMADGISSIVTGRGAAVVSQGKDGNEFEKRLTGLMLSGDLIAHLDNVERQLEGDTLCQAISQPWMLLRPLGGSAMLRVPARCFFIATGNNVIVRGDLTRRVMLIRLDAKTERPEARTFERDFLADIRANRAELVRAALVVMRAYQIAGCPPIERHTAVGSFEAWDRLVRRPLLWLGLDDPLAPAEQLREDDPDRSAMRALFNALRATYGDQIVTAATMAEDAARAAARFDGGGREHDHPDLHDALEQIAGANPNARQIGYALRRYRGRMVDGLVLEAAGPTGRAKVQGWCVKSISTSSSSLCG